MKKAWNLLMISALAAALTQGCVDYGNECDSCSDDDDCNAGLTCERFEVAYGDTYYLCATPSTYTCVVEEHYFTGASDIEDVDREPVDVSEPVAERQPL